METFSETVRASKCNVMGRKTVGHVVVISRIQLLFLRLKLDGLQGQLTKAPNALR